jgi:hypothetical protein
MFFQIRKIILWPKKANLKPRVLKFELDSVNVISGASKTGKSAIIPIVDYCLGSEKCTIPVNTIRDSCEWFGILVQTINGQKLFARREPGGQKATGDMFVLEGVNIEIPDRIEGKNTNLDNVKHSLDELVGLTALDFDPNDISNGFKARPSFRDMSAFVFQPQNIIANPDIFFYKADTYEHREKLRTIFPYILNAITPQILAKRHEHNLLKKELRRKASELETVRQVSERWMAEIRSRVAEAKELGLIKVSVSSEAGRGELFKLLKDVVSSSVDEIQITSETVSDAVGELLALQREETEVSNQLAALKKRFTEMSELKESTIQYQGTLHIQRDRLKISEWLQEKHNSSHNCPICGNQFVSTMDQLDKLYHSLKEIEKTAGEFDTIPAAFDREFERVRADMRILSEKLQGIRIRRQGIEKISEEAKNKQYETLRVSRFIGNVEQSLETYARIGTDSVLDNEIQELQNHLTVLEKEIAEAGVKGRVERALAKVQANAQRLLPDLDAEHPNDPVLLSIDDLTIKVQGADREDYLWEIGSGSNWLAYHIAITLGLQQFFVGLEQSPIPNFIIYDQPSQVYFPKKLAVQNVEEDNDPELEDEDLAAVRKVFKALSTIVGKCNLQVIVLDHASEKVWTNLDKINFVEEWRDGKKLVPMEWIKS